MQARSKRMLHTLSKTPLDSIVGVVGVCRCQVGCNYHRSMKSSKRGPRDEPKVGVCTSSLTSQSFAPPFWHCIRGGPMFALGMPCVVDASPSRYTRRIWYYASGTMRLFSSHQTSLFPSQEFLGGVQRWRFRSAGVANASPALPS